MRTAHFPLVALFLTYAGLVNASLERDLGHDTFDHAVSRRLAFDLFSPQGQAQTMLHCLGEGPSQHADTKKVINWMQSNPPSGNDSDPNALFSLNPQDWGFHIFRKRSSHNMNNWRRDGKSLKMKKRLQTYREKLLMCNNKLNSEIRQSSSLDAANQSSNRPDHHATKSVSTQDDAILKNTDSNSTGHNTLPQQGSSIPAKGSDQQSEVGKPMPPGLATQQPGVTPVLDPGQKLLPQPGGLNASSKANPLDNSSSDSTTRLNTNAASSPGCEQLVDRPEYSTLSVEQKTAFITAVKCVQTKPSRYNQDGMNAFDDWVLLHIQMLKYVHFTAYFLVFHRAMLAVVEKDLRDCGLPFGMPWIDWTQYANDGSLAAIFDSDPDYGFGSNGQGTADKCPYGSGRQVLDGAFAGVTFNAPFKHSLCREFNNMDVQHPNAHWGNNCTVFLTDRFNDGLLTAHNEGKFFDFASALEISAHTAVHTCVGGNMPWLSSSANDLTFYLHHAWVDRQFGIWQSQSPSNRYAFQGPKKQTKNGAHPPWDATTDDVMNLKPLSANVKVSDVLDYQSGNMDGLMCYRYTS